MVTFLVMLDVERLRQRLAAVEGVLSEREVRAWLAARGYEPTPSGVWLATADRLADLGPGDVTLLRRLRPA